MTTGSSSSGTPPLAEVLRLPAHGEVVPDVRGEGRWMRVTWHQEADLGASVVVLSVWREGTCIGTARVARDDVPALVHALVSGLAGDPDPAPHGHA